ncbi:hypothetical protein [Pallidibacillus pasinlerensis]|uniref:hypothetical protein n=1 Tax=Pallidibacillus pasinlerensis TaxID=2703818 RepID=UPI00192A6A26|nr:hypothetical protein [Pallidibacillus pasinlerensis]
MGKGGKSKRFVSQASNAVEQHAKRIPYHLTYAEAEARKMREGQDSPIVHY